MEIKDFLNENETDMFAIALEKEMRAVEVINTVVAQSNVSDEQKALLNSFKVLLEQAIEEKDLTFYEGAKDTIEEIIGKENDEEFDISNLDEVSAHAFAPILKDDEDVAKAATSVHAYLFMYKGEKDVKLSALIYKFMRDNGLDDPVDVWKPIGLGLKNWHNLITRYEDEDGKRAKKLTLLYVAIALRLNIEQTRELLENQFHRLTKSKQDLIFTYHIVNREIPVSKEGDHAMMAKKEIDQIREELDDYGLEVLSVNYE